MTTMPRNETPTQAIFTTAIGPAQSHGGKIKAIASAGSQTVKIDDDNGWEKDGWQRHWPAALKLIRFLNWPEDKWIVGGLPNQIGFGDGYVFTRDTTTELRKNPNP